MYLSRGRCEVSLLLEQSDSFGQTRAQAEIRFWNEPGLLSYDEWLSPVSGHKFMVSSDQTGAVIRPSHKKRSV